MVLEGMKGFDEISRERSARPTQLPSARTGDSVGCRNDYVSVTFSPVDGSPWAVLYKDQCSTFACVDELDPNKTLDSFETNLLGAVATMKTK